MLSRSTLAAFLVGLVLASCGGEEFDDADIEAAEFSMQASDPIPGGYYNWATCTGQPTLIVYNGPGPGYGRSTIKPSCKFGEVAYVKGTEAGSNGQKYARLPGWGTHVGSGGKYGYADARWLMRGYKLTLSKLFTIVKNQKICSDSFEQRYFLFTNKVDADNGAIILNGLHALTEKGRQEGKSDSQIVDNISTLIGTIPVVGNLVSIMKRAVDSTTINTWKGEWRVSREGAFYSVSLWT